jgi:hypothetical protein
MRFRYGAEGIDWIERINNNSYFIASNKYFKYDPAPMVKKVIQILKYD